MGYQKHQIIGISLYDDHPNTVFSAIDASTSGIINMRHRSDEGFEVMSNSHIFKPVRGDVIITLPLCPARAAVTNIPQVDEGIDVDLSDLDLTPPDSSRTITRPMTEEKAVAIELEEAFGRITHPIHKNVVKRPSAATVLDEAALGNLINNLELIDSRKR